MKFIFMKSLIAAILLTVSSISQAEMTTEILELQKNWAEIKYRLDPDRQEAAFDQLAKKAGQVREQQSQQAEAHVWEGIILSTYAGVKGGLGALGLVKKARAAFEKAIEIDPSAMHGSAYTSLGSLYYQVPGWPVGFGDDEKAGEYLLKGLALNPDGIDSNYFYGDYLLDQDKLADAEKAFRKALQAADRPDRPVADEGRRGEIQAALDRIKAEQSVAKRTDSVL